MVFYVLHNVLQTTGTLYSVFRCRNVLIVMFSVFMCIVGSKRVMLVGRSRGPPPKLFLAVFIQNGTILCNNDGYMY